MNPFLSEAILSAHACSMHCIEPGKDALYDIQLAPLKNQKTVLKKSSDVLWGVFAQYARNGEEFKWATKLSPASRSAALAMYRQVRLERMDHGYVDVLPSRESNLDTLKGKAISTAFSGLPHLEAYADAVSQACAYVDELEPDLLPVSTGALAVYADLAMVLPDGCVQVPQLCESLKEDTSALFKHLTQEMQKWLETRYTDLDAQLKAALALSQLLTKAAH